MTSPAATPYSGCASVKVVFQTEDGTGVRVRDQHAAHAGHLVDVGLAVPPEAVGDLSGGAQSAGVREEADECRRLAGPPGSGCCEQQVGRVEQLGGVHRVNALGLLQVGVQPVGVVRRAVWGGASLQLGGYVVSLMTCPSSTWRGLPSSSSPMTGRPGWRGSVATTSSVCRPSSIQRHDALLGQGDRGCVVGHAEAPGLYVRALAQGRPTVHRCGLGALGDPVEGRADERLGKITFWTLFVGFHGTFLVQHWLGANSMARDPGLPGGGGADGAEHRVERVLSS
ncbi:hypothetical protein STENM327S_04519 [Streptomyces tendae]